MDKEKLAQQLDQAMNSHADLCDMLHEFAHLRGGNIEGLRYAVHRVIKEITE